MRLDQYIAKQFNLSRSKATDLIKLGNVTIDGNIITKPSFIIMPNYNIEINNIFKYVSRSGLKLEDAIKTYNLDFSNKIVIDVGSSAGGFTQCSLEYGAKKVYAYDVGKNQMDPLLRDNPKVELFEETNILDVSLASADICLIDVSFTSVEPIIKHIKDSCKEFVILYKPQFEVGPKHIYGGIVKNQNIIDESIQKFKTFLLNENITITNYKASDLKGKKGNQEYLFIGERNVKNN